jgi:hypothetical protein
VKSSSASGKLPETGVPEFDKLMAGTARYLQWVAWLESLGYTVIEQSLTEGSAAEIEGSVILIDPAQFRYIDLLHESRHIRQIDLALRLGFDPFVEGKFAKMLRAWFEFGAYEYERRLSKIFGFSSEYRDYLERQINHYWKRAYRKKLRFSSNLRNRFNRIWR